MKNHMIAMVAGLVLSTAAAQAHAVLTLNLSADKDLTTLAPGDSFIVSVALDGLDVGAGQVLPSLASSVIFDDSLLNVSPLVTPGAIVSEPLQDPFDFFGATAPGLADATFFTFSFDPDAMITSNGVFYSFQLTAAQAGAGQIQFDSLALSAESFVPPQDFFLVDVFAGDPLNYVITAPTNNAIPEPATASLAMLALAALTAGRRRRR